MKFWAIIVAMAALLAPALGSAAGATKIGVLDLQAVVLTSAAGKGGMAELEKNKDYSGLMADIEKHEKQLKSMEDELNGKGLTWSADQKTKHREKMGEVVKERQQALMAINRARESVFVQMLGAMEPAIAKVLDDVMKAEGIDLVLDSKAVIHKMPSADITAMVVERLNKLTQQNAAGAKSKPKK